MKNFYFIILGCIVLCAGSMHSMQEEKKAPTELQNYNPHETWLKILIKAIELEVETSGLIKILKSALGVPVYLGNSLNPLKVSETKCIYFVKLAVTHVSQGLLQQLIKHKVTIPQDFPSLLNKEIPNFYEKFADKHKRSSYDENNVNVTLDFLAFAQKWIDAEKGLPDAKEQWQQDLITLDTTNK